MSNGHARFPVSRSKSAAVVVTLLVGALSLASCKQKPARINVKPAKLTLYGLNKTEIVKAEVVDANGKAVEDSIPTFQSSNPKVATVEPSGLVRGVAPGSAVVTASFESLSARCSIEVVDVATMTISPTRATVAGPKGTTALFKAEARDSKGAVVALPPSWTSSAPKVATIDANGVVTSVSEGRTGITVQLGDIGASADVRVLFREIAAFAVLPKNTILKAKDVQKLTVAAHDVAGAPIEDVAILWVSSDPKVAVCRDGVITAVSPGTAILKGTCGAFSAEITVIVL